MLCSCVGLPQLVLHYLPQKEATRMLQAAWALFTPMFDELLRLLRPPAPFVNPPCVLMDAVQYVMKCVLELREVDTCMMQAAWALFTPVLDELEESCTIPELYPYGSRGPVGAHYLAAKVQTFNFQYLIERLTHSHI